jgi:hypothetical protein
MTDPLEVLQWHESERERTDSQVIAQGRRFQLVEKRPAPLNMSIQEREDWIEEMRPVIEWQEGDEYTISGVYLTLPEIGRTFAKTLREAVCRAASKWKELNNDI